MRAIIIGSMGAVVGSMGTINGSIISSMGAKGGSMVGSLTLEDDSKWLDGPILGKPGRLEGVEC